MSGIGVYTDEDVHAAVAAGLRKAGLDAVSTPESGRRGMSDESQLAWATGEGRVLLTFNVADFAALHADWIARNRNHAGIVVSGQRNVGDLLRRVLHLAGTLDAAAMQNRLEYASDW